VLPWPAFSQQPSRPAQSGTFADVVGSVAQLESDQQKTAELRRYEEIEIMRRILEQRIRRLAALPRGNLSLARPVNKVSDHNGAAFLDFDNDGVLDIVIANVQTPPGTAGDAWRQLFHGDDSIRKAHAGVAPFEAVEGFYLKGYGIVYTAALAVHFQEPVRRAAQPAPRPLSDWERIRKELHGEKIEAGKTETPQKHDSVAESLLKVLAENGHNFRQLPDNEQVTVALTLRRGQDCMGCHKSVDLSGAPDSGGVRNLFDASQSMNQAGKAGPSGSNPLADSAATRALEWIKGQPSEVSKAANSNQGTKPSPDFGIDLDSRIQKSDAQNHTLLGDLSMKQGRYKEAAAAYRKALDDHQKSIGSQAGSSQSSNGVQGQGKLQGEIAAVELASKLALAALATGDPDDALKALQEVAQHSNRLERSYKFWKESQRGDKPSPKAAPLPLPAKVIISTPKRLLDQVGAGKISFEDFKKAAHVQYLNFAGTKAQAGVADSK